MKHLIRFKASRAVWVAALTAVLAGVVAAPGQASHPPKFKKPTLQYGELTINGTKASESSPSG